MPFFDLKPEQLAEYRPSVRRPADFDEFWADTLAEVRSFDLAPALVRVDNSVKLVDTYDVTFAGFGGHPVKAWLHVPAGTTGPLPTVIQYHGYSQGRMLAWQNHLYAEAGYAHLSVDTRGQGWSAVSDTPDRSPDAGDTTIPGLMTKGILSPGTYYYRRVYADAVRAVEAARGFDLVDADRIVVAGGSQGGGITIAAAGLVDGLAGAMPDVPFLSNFERAIGLTDADPYHELVRYLERYRDREELVLDTLSYFDGVNFAARATVPALFSAALMDMVCPPSTVYAAHHAWGGDSSLDLYRFNGHEGGGEHHQLRKFAFLRGIFGE